MRNWTAPEANCEEKDIWSSRTMCQARTQWHKWVKQVKPWDKNRFFFNCCHSPWLILATSNLFWAPASYFGITSWQWHSAKVSWLLQQSMMTMESHGKLMESLSLWASLMMSFTMDGEAFLQFRAPLLGLKLAPRPGLCSWIRLKEGSPTITVQRLSQQMWRKRSTLQL